MENTDIVWKRRTVIEKKDGNEKDGRLLEEQTVIEKMISYRKEGQLWKRRTVMELPVFFHINTRVRVRVRQPVSVCPCFPVHCDPRYYFYNEFVHHMLKTTSDIR